MRYFTRTIPVREYRVSIDGKEYMVDGFVEMSFSHTTDSSTGISTVDSPYVNDAWINLVYLLNVEGDEYNKLPSVDAFAKDHKETYKKLVFAMEQEVLKDFEKYADDGDSDEYWPSESDRQPEDLYE